MKYSILPDNAYEIGLEYTVSFDPIYTTQCRQQDISRFGIKFYSSELGDEELELESVSDGINALVNSIMATATIEEEIYKITVSTTDSTLFGQTLYFKFYAATQDSFKYSDLITISLIEFTLDYLEF